MPTDFDKHLDEDTVESLLSGTLSELRLREVESHVEQCGICRQKMDDSAAATEVWDQIGNFLTNDELDVQPDSHDDASSVPSVRRDSESDIRQIIAWLSPTDDPEMLGRIGHYEVSGVIGAGGMSVVLKALDRALNRYVAIKVLAPHLATSGAARQRFAREAQAAAAVVHDNVVAIHGVSEADGLPYLVMPYLRGASLQRRIDDAGALSVNEILRVGMQTARGLHAAHQQGIVHRDIKPANILREGATDRVMLTDFGLARAADDASLTHSGVIAGTPYFMSPEQAMGAAIDSRSDIFSLGSVLYTLATGRPPFRAETSWGILRKVTDSAPRSIRQINPRIPAWLEGIVFRCLEKKPNLRYASADDLAADLECGLAHVQDPTRIALPQRLRVTSPVYPRWYWAAITGLAVVIVCAVLIWRNPIVEFGSHGSDSTAETSAPDSVGDDESDTAKSDGQPLPDEQTIPEWDEGIAEELRILRERINAVDAALPRGNETQKTPGVMND